MTWIHYLVVVAVALIGVPIVAVFVKLYHDRDSPIRPIDDDDLRALDNYHRQERQDRNDNDRRNSEGFRE
jgi:hypothetical protein